MNEEEMTKQIDEKFSKVFDKIDVNPQTAVILLTLLGGYISTITADTYLNYRRVSFDDFVKVLDNYLNGIKESAMLKYKMFVKKENY